LRGFPPIEIVSASEINGANGAFSGQTNRIYLSREYLLGNATNIAAIVRVLLEETGHWVDQFLNEEEDSAGDEGAIFAALVMGEHLSDQALAQLKTEDDSGVINVNGQLIAVEQQNSIGTTELASISSDGTQANSPSDNVAISADGRYVAFSSFADNLVSGDTNFSADIFVRDLVTGTVERVSVASDGTQANSFSDKVSISADGRYVAFSSDADNLVSGDTNFTVDVFVHDRVTGVTERVNVASDGTQANNSSPFPFPSFSNVSRWKSLNNQSI
jgi:hypothetical protein